MFSIVCSSGSKWKTVFESPFLAGLEGMFIFFEIPNCSNISLRLSFFSFNKNLISSGFLPLLSGFVSGIGNEIILEFISSGKMIDGKPPYVLSNPFLLKITFILLCSSLILL